MLSRTDVVLDNKGELAGGKELAGDQIGEKMSDKMASSFCTQNQEVMKSGPDQMFPWNASTGFPSTSFKHI